MRRWIYEPGGPDSSHSNNILSSQTVSVESNGHLSKNLPAETITRSPSLGLHPNHRMPSGQRRKAVVVTRETQRVEDDVDDQFDLDLLDLTDSENVVAMKLRVASSCTSVFPALSRSDIGTDTICLRGRNHRSR